MAAPVVVAVVSPHHGVSPEMRHGGAEPVLEGAASLAVSLACSDQPVPLRTKT